MFDDGFETLRCRDCAETESMVTDVAPDGSLPIPGDALLGFPDGVPKRPRGLTRRDLMRNGAIGMAAVYGASQISWEGVWENAIAQAAEPMQKSLVMVFLNGGNDGVNCFVPTTGGSPSAAYLAARGAAGRDIARVTGPNAGGKIGSVVMPNSADLAFANPLLSTAGGGDNGDATQGLDTLWGAGNGTAGSDLAIFPATDYMPSNQSHFESRDFYFAGALAKMQTGWLGRWLDLYGSTVNPLQAVSLDTGLSKMIRSSKAPVSALSGLGGVRFRVSGADASANDATAHIGDLAATPASATNEALSRSRATFGLTVDMSNRLQALGNPAGAAGYPPNSSLSSRLQLAGTLLGAGLGTRIITIEWGGFDTHGNQIGSQDPQLRVLSRALAAFKADLTARGIEQNVVTCVFSEFGRRVDSNEALGTDHGAGGPMMMMGSAIRGGIGGEMADVGTPDRNGNLQVKTDFRTVYQSIIAEWLGGDPTAVLPGGGFPGIDGLLDSHTRLLK